MAEKKAKEEKIICPVGTFLQILKRYLGEIRRFTNTWSGLRLNFLKASSRYWMSGLNALSKRILKKPAPK